MRRSKYGPSSLTLVWAVTLVPLLLAACGIFGDDNGSKSAGVTPAPTEDALSDATGEVTLSDSADAPLDTSVDCTKTGRFCSDAPVLPMTCLSASLKTTYDEMLTRHCPTADWLEVYELKACGRLVVRTFGGSPGVIVGLFDSTTHVLLGLTIYSDTDCQRFGETAWSACQANLCNLMCYKDKPSFIPRNFGCGGKNDAGAPIVDAWADYDAKAPF